MRKVMERLSLTGAVLAAAFTAFAALVGWR